MVTHLSWSLRQSRFWPSFIFPSPGQIDPIVVLLIEDDETVQLVRSMTQIFNELFFILLVGICEFIREEVIDIYADSNRSTGWDERRTIDCGGARLIVAEVLRQRVAMRQNSERRDTCGSELIRLIRIVLDVVVEVHRIARFFVRRADPELHRVELRS